MTLPWKKPVDGASTAAAALSEPAELKLETDTAPIVRRGILFLLIGLGGFMAWAIWAPLDAGIPAQGVVTVDTKRKTVQHLTGGIIEQVLVHEGQSVNQNDLLIRLNDSQSRAEFETVRQRYISLRATEDRLLAEQANLPAVVFHADVQKERGDPLIAQHVVSQEQLFLSRKQALRSELASLDEAEQSQRDAIRGYSEQLESRRRQAVFLREEVSGMREMVKEGYAPRNKLLELERMSAELDATASELRSSLARAQRAVAELAIRKQQRTQQFGKDIDFELAQLRRDVSADAERIKAAREALARSEIRAPVSGSVIGIANQTVGGVLTPGARIMDVVPRDELLMLEAKIPPHLIDRIRVDQEADIRFSNFSSSPQLVVEGKLVSLSADLLVDPVGGGYYLARVAVTPKGVEALAQHRLQPGMPAEIIIKTGERSLLTYLLHPLTRRLVQAMKEE